MTLNSAYLGGSKRPQWLGSRSSGPLAHAPFSGSRLGPALGPRRRKGRAGGAQAAAGRHAGTRGIAQPVRRAAAACPRAAVLSARRAAVPQAGAKSPAPLAASMGQGFEEGGGGGRGGGGG